MARTNKVGTKKTQTTQKRPAAEKTSAKRESATSSTESAAPATLDRRSSNDRRKTSDRRKKTSAVAVERRKIERRVKVNRRRQIDPTTCERDYSSDEIEFMSALDEYKRTSGRMFPTCSEILEVIKKLGYQKCAASGPAGLPVAEIAGGPPNGSGQVREEHEAVA